MSRIPIDQVGHHPLPGTVAPRMVRFAPDGRSVTWLASEPADLVQQLYAVDLETGARRNVVRPPPTVAEADLPLEEQLRRERLRERATGVTRYAWSESAGRLLLPLGGDLFVQDGLDGELHKLVDGAAGPILDPAFSPDGAQVAFVRDAELYVVPSVGGEARQLTTGARGTGRTHGLAEYIAQEEMKRMRGFWWSRDGRRLAFVEVDETHIPVFHLPHSGKDQVLVEEHRYPFAGAPNARVRLGVISVDGGDVAWMDLSCGGTVAWEYLARVHAAPDGGFVAEVQDRLQQQLHVVRLDAATGRGAVVLTERQRPWLNLHDLFRPLAGGAFLWGSERSGFQHLYRVSADGSDVRAVTEGAWMVEEIVALDEARGLVWFLGTADGPTERHLYEVSLSGGEVRRLTPDRGYHTVVVDKKTRRFVDTWSSLDDQPRLVLRSLDDGAAIRELHRTSDPRVAELGVTAPRHLVVQTRDGATLHAAMWVPEGDGPFPTLVSVYGGPHAQRVVDDWSVTADLRARYLADRGFLVMRLDNRGSARRGLAFEGAIDRDLGNLELEDQIDGVRHLVGLGLADAARVGIYGWSYGGYLSAMAVCRHPDVFRAAVAGAPVTHWDGYDTHYTERYMGTPADNARGYEVGSVMHHVAGLRGHLLLVHGLIDENVHFRHTARLLDALVRHRKRHEVLLFPNERHMPRGAADRTYLEERIRDFFEVALA